VESRESAIPLKRSAKRSVERSAGSGAEVVKRFHSPGRLDRLRDRARASSEYETLCKLTERGLAVPRPIAVRHTAHGWELVTAWIDGAASLSDVLAGRTPWPTSAEELVRSLGGLLARAHAIGLDHPDLHSGNVLVADGARAWLVDVHGARLTARPSARIAVRDLVQLAADTRERLSLGLRVRLLAAWRAALPPAFARTLPPQAELAETVEREARIRRRATLERARRRWTRNSSSCRARSIAGFSGFVSAELGDCDPLPYRTGAGQVLLEDLAPRKLRAHWYASARLCDHGLRAARPLVFSCAPEAWAAFGLPRGTRSLSQALHDADQHARRTIAASIGDLAGSLFDRGLSLSELSADSLFVDEHHAVWLGSIPSIHAVAIDAPPLSIGGPDWALVLRSVVRSDDERIEFASAFVRAQRSGRPTRARVARELRAALEVSSNG
jgi:tRNA A-37 threonylcarbamoyl transferase component Bud32